MSPDENESLIRSKILEHINANFPHQWTQLKDKAAEIGRRKHHALQAMGNLKDHTKGKTFNAQLENALQLLLDSTKSDKHFTENEVVSFVFNYYKESEQFLSELGRPYDRDVKSIMESVQNIVLAELTLISESLAQKGAAKKGKALTWAEGEAAKVKPPETGRQN